MRPLPGDILSVIYYAAICLFPICFYLQTVAEGLNVELDTTTRGELTHAPTMKPVPKEKFEKQLNEARTYYDIMRIFYGGDISNEMIDKTLVLPRRSGQDGVPFHLSPEGRLSLEVFSRHDVLVDQRLIDIVGKVWAIETNQALDEYQELKEKAKCQIPKIKVINIRQFSTAPNRLYYPECTVIHQCQKESGCCNDTSECGVKSTQKISRKFLTLQIMGSDSLVPYERFVETFEFTNHTECQCNPIKMLPICKACPFPFIIRRKGEDCSCDCFDRDETCIPIKKGRKPLLDADITCVLLGNCHVPECKYGPYSGDSFSTGYCPKKSGKSLRRKNRGRKKKRTKSGSRGKKKRRPDPT